MSEKGEQNARGQEMEVFAFTKGTPSHSTNCTKVSPRQEANQPCRQDCVTVKILEYLQIPPVSPTGPD